MINPRPILNEVTSLLPIKNGFDFYFHYLFSFIVVHTIIPVLWFLFYCLGSVSSVELTHTNPWLVISHTPVTHMSVFFTLVVPSTLALQHHSRRPGSLLNLLSLNVFVGVHRCHSCKVFSVLRKYLVRWFRSPNLNSKSMTSEDIVLCLL